MAEGLHRNPNVLTALKELSELAIQDAPIRLSFDWGAHFLIFSHNLPLLLHVFLFQCLLICALE